ncbi:hypothetical protein ACHRV5_00875 [Flavobacterium sp. FlaQc-52]|jgi:hypothetical protein|uniref:hypothetical protein n=1 Tax=Flavobacterium sp. FlaQc-52 TaxID=3374185 RepID=UPI0037582C0E
MSTFRGKNLRSGDLAEQLGILLLQNVALVAPIPRTEDVGIDVVATLIKPFDGYKYIAEDSFFVQIKSSSVTEIIFKDEQVKWLAELQLPFFIASVNRKTSIIYLYSTHYLSDVLVMNPNRKEIILQLTENSHYDCGDKEETIKLPIGPCIISWSLETFTTNGNFLNDFYDLLKSHISTIKKSIETRRVGVVELINWETGKTPVIVGVKIQPNHNSKKTDEIISPYFSALIHKLTLGEDLSTTRSLYRLLEKTLERKGHFTIVDGKKELIPFKANLEDITNE